MLGPASLKRLEALVHQSAEALKRLTEENAKLKKASDKLDEENRHLKERLRKLETVAAKHERVRVRLVKLSQKLEKIS